METTETRIFFHFVIVLNHFYPSIHPPSMGDYIQNLSFIKILSNWGYLLRSIQFNFKVLIVLLAISFDVHVHAFVLNLILIFNRQFGTLVLWH